ncbi:hypothetical protein C8F04DRAFT_1184565 [Mycena alexandri]|uniref:Uncharacterized protein n=1 Tax=Mycena alexandri TaxID=1745969 RepID=A0AAD6X240_9AGAR|nr:hypothetical protein C8F04DRAFT_1184565 [Mycena alexandri]
MPESNGKPRKAEPEPNFQETKRVIVLVEVKRLLRGRGPESNGATKLSDCDILVLEPLTADNQKHLHIMYHASQQSNCTQHFHKSGRFGGSKFLVQIFPKIPQDTPGDIGHKFRRKI